MKLFLIFFLAISIPLLFLLISKRLRIFDKPHLYADTTGRKPVPTIQGVFFFVSICILIGVRDPTLLLEASMQGLLIGGAVLVITGTLDDVFFGNIRFPALLRLGIQIGVSVFAIWYSGVGIQELSILGQTLLFPQRLSIGISTIWFIVCINAVNRFDGINSQASGVASIGFGTIWTLITFVVLTTYKNIQPDTLTILTTTKTVSLFFCLMTAIYAGIERKPRGLVRDGGTFLYGFALAYLSLLGGAKIGTMLVVLSLVIFDALRVCCHRVFFMKKMPRKGDFSHLHHRLLRLGRSKKEVNIFIRGWSLVMMVLMILQGDNKFSKIVIFCMMAVAFFGINAYLFWIKKIPCGLDAKKES